MTTLITYKYFILELNGVLIKNHEKSLNFDASFEL